MRPSTEISSKQTALMPPGCLVTARVHVWPVFCCSSANLASILALLCALRLWSWLILVILCCRPYMVTWGRQQTKKYLPGPQGCGEGGCPVRRGWCLALYSCSTIP